MPIQHLPMEKLYQPFLLVSIVTFFASFAIFSFLKPYINQTRKNSVPEGGHGWPVIGHLPLFCGSELPHKVLATMADTYGPMFMIRIGVHRVLVISSSKLAEECLHANDMAVSGRPRSVAGDILTYNYAMFGLGPYGPYWRHMCKILMLELLSNHRLSKVSHVWKSEVNEFIRDLGNLWNANQNKRQTSRNGESNYKVLVDLKKMFGDLNTKIIVKITTGKKLDLESLEFQQEIREFMVALGSFSLGDALPFLRWVDIGGQKKAMRRTFVKIDEILQRWLDEHKQKKTGEDKDENKDKDKDMMDAMLSVVDHEVVKECNYDVDTIIKATCLSAISGGTNTSAITFTWALSLLLNNLHVLKRAQEELATQVGKDRQVEESDIPHLVYLQAIVKETLRLNPPGPLMAPREFIEDCNINGYHVKSGTQLIVNLHKIFRDPTVWEDPLEFRPERFLMTHKDVDFLGKHFGYIPFGVGRRICPGISFSLQVMHLTLACLLHAFELSTPSEEPVDMSERFGLTSAKAEPLEVLIAPSLSCRAYL